MLIDGYSLVQIIDFTIRLCFYWHKLEIKTHVQS